MPRSLLLLLAGCATVPLAPPAQEPAHLEMEPVRIQATPDPLTGLDAYDAGDLLEKGNGHFDAADYDRALAVYDFLVKQFPDSSLVPTALYNAGLSLEKLAEHDEAVRRFQRVIAEHPESTTAKDAFFRAGVSLSKLERWRDVEQTFWAVRQRGPLSAMDEIEARAGVAVALFMQQEHATAEREFTEILRFYEKHEQKEYLPAGYWVAQSRFYLAEIAAREFERSALASDKLDHDAWRDDVAARLEEKCERLLRAQALLIRTIREGHTGWATAAGYRIGSLYERLYDDLNNVPVPPGLEGEAKDYYKDEVKKRVAVLVRKAIMVYEKSLDMAGRVGESNEWVDRTNRALERMKTLALGASG